MAKATVKRKPARARIMDEVFRRPGLVNRRMIAEDLGLSYGYVKRTVDHLALCNRIQIEDNGNGDIRLWPMHKPDSIL